MRLVRCDIFLSELNSHTALVNFAGSQRAAMSEHFQQLRSLHQDLFEQQQLLHDRWGFHSEVSMNCLDTDADAVFKNSRQRAALCLKVATKSI